MALYVYQKVRYVFPGFIVCRRRAIAHVINTAIRQYEPWTPAPRFQNWYTWALVTTDGWEVARHVFQVKGSTRRSSGVRMVGIDAFPYGVWR